MSEAEAIGYVILALVVIAGLYFTVYTPMKNNVQAMTKLTCSVDTLSDKLLNLESKNTESHRRLWKQVERQDKVLDAHEKRLHELDGGWSEENIVN